MRGILFVLLLSISSSCYSQGIDFQQISLEEALVKAQKEDKLIFIDFYTVWCGPCKALAKGVFMDAEIGDFYNKNFINLKLDAEKEGKEAAQKYEIKAYPTLLFVGADGKQVHRGGTASMTTLSDAIAFAEKALDMQDEVFGIEYFKEMYAEKKEDEVFLKAYLNELLKYRMDAIEVAENWLEVQTEFDDASREMMEFLLNHRFRFYLGGKAESILTANREHYNKIASESEIRKLDRLEVLMLMHTLPKAYAIASPELIRLYIQGSKEKKLNTCELPYLELEYLRFSEDKEAYKTATRTYVDSLISNISIAEEKKAVETIVKIGHNYLANCNKNTDFEVINEWIEYCSELLPEDYRVINLHADLLFAMGDTSQAIQLKQQAIGNIAPNHKKNIIKLESELEEMKK